MSTNRRGFTLVELLVVIAIIGILAAIIFPVFGKARDKARETQCIANQRQIALMALMAVDDNGEKYPTAGDLWNALKDNGKVLICPTVGGTTNAYGYNTYIQGVAQGSILALDEVLLTADSDNAANTLSTPDDIAVRHSSGIAVASYADGHVAKTKQVFPGFTSGRLFTASNAPLGVIVDNTGVSTAYASISEVAPYTTRNDGVVDRWFLNQGTLPAGTDALSMVNVPTPTGDKKALYVKNGGGQTSGAFVFAARRAAANATASYSSFVFEMGWRQVSTSAGPADHRYCFDLTSTMVEYLGGVIPATGFGGFGNANNQATAAFVRQDNYGAAYDMIWANGIGNTIGGTSGDIAGFFIDLNPTRWGTTNLGSVPNVFANAQTLSEDNNRKVYFNQVNNVKMAFISPTEVWYDFGDGDSVRKATTAFTAADNAELVNTFTFYAGNATAEMWIIDPKMKWF